MAEPDGRVPQQPLRELTGTRRGDDKALPVLPVLYRDHLEEALVLRVPRGDVVGLVHHNKLSQPVDASEPPRLLEQLLEENLAEENLAEENLAEENLAEENLAEENLDEENLAEENLA